FDELRLQYRRGLGASHQAVEKESGAAGRERIEPELRVTTLVDPAVFVLWPVADEQQNTMTRQAVDQRVEYRLRLGVDPVKIFDDEDDRLDAALLEEQQLHRVQCAPQLLGGVEQQPLRVFWSHIEKGQDGGTRWRQRLPERPELLRHPIFEPAGVVPRLDVE